MRVVLLLQEGRRWLRDISRRLAGRGQRGQPRRQIGLKAAAVPRADGGQQRTHEVEATANPLCGL